MKNDSDWRTCAILSLDEIALYADVPRPTVFHWFTLAQAMGRICGVKQGRNRYFNGDDMFLAALLGALHRRGIQVKDVIIRNALGYMAGGIDAPAENAEWRVFDNDYHADIVIPIGRVWRHAEAMTTRRPHAS
ncbi:MAG: hypothetical protein ACXIVE_05920 [Salinarimonas sp.]